MLWIIYILLSLIISTNISFCLNLFGCGGSCLTCQANNPSYCTSCASLLTLSLGSCSCPPGSYDTAALLGTPCNPCDSSCTTCTGSSSSECTSCPLDAFIYQGACYQNCNSSTYFNYTSLTCQLCSTDCLECSGPSSSECTSCSYGALSNGVCQCGSGLYKDNTYTCQQCNNICQECTGPSSQNCTACYSNLALQNGQCGCSTGSYLSLSPLGCSTCHQICLECNGPTSNDCTSCPNNLVLSTGQCFCQQKTYFDATTTSCKSCSVYCEKCSGPLSNQCSFCKSGLILSNGECLCPQGPYFNLSLIGSSNFECSSCQIGYARFKNNAGIEDCVSQCPSLYYVNSVLNSNTNTMICVEKIGINNRLTYGTVSSQVMILMKEYTAYDFTKLMNSIDIFIRYNEQQTPIKYTYSFGMAPDRTYITIDFTFNSHLLPDSVLTLRFQDFTEDNSTSYYLLNILQNLQLDEIYVYPNSTDNIWNMTIEAAQVLKPASKVMAWFSSFLSSSVHSMRSQIVEDMLAYFFYMNIRFSPNFIKFENETQSLFYFFMPDLLGEFLDSLVKSPKNFFTGFRNSDHNVDMGFSLNRYAPNRLFLINFGSTLSFLIITLVFICSFEGLKRLVPKLKCFKIKFLPNSLFTEALNKVSFALQWNFVINQHFSVYVDLTFHSLIQIANGFHYTTLLGYAEYVIAIIGLTLSNIWNVLLLLLAFQILKILKNRSYYAQHDKSKESTLIEQKYFLQRHRVLHLSFRSEKYMHLLYPFLLVSRAFGFVLAVIFLPHIPVLQALYVSVSTVFVIAFLFRCKPFKSKFQGILTLLYEALFLTTCLITLVLYFYNSKYLADINTRSWLGFGIIVCNLCMAILDVLSAIVDSIELIISLRRSRRTIPSSSIPQLTSRNLINQASQLIHPESHRSHKIAKKPQLSQNSLLIDSFTASKQPESLERYSTNSKALLFRKVVNRGSRKNISDPKGRNVMSPSNSNMVSGIKECSITIIDSEKDFMPSQKRSDDRSHQRLREEAQTIKLTHIIINNQMNEYLRSKNETIQDIDHEKVSRSSNLCPESIRINSKRRLIINRNLQKSIGSLTNTNPTQNNLQTSLHTVFIKKRREAVMKDDPYSKKTE